MTTRDYHQRTKHSPASVRASPMSLDWENQPLAFKVYPDLDPLPLPTDLPGSQVPALAAIAGTPAAAQRPMDVAVLAPRNLGHWIQTAFGVLRPGRHKVPNMEVLRGSRITVTSDRPQPRQLDGDVIDESATLDVTVRPDALWVCVYQPDTSEDLAEGSTEQD